MIGALVIVAQLASASPADTLYTSAALRALVEGAARSNAAVPPTLAAYAAHLETEMSLTVVDTLGRERTGQVEQMGGTATWNADSGFLARVQGYRMETVGLPISFVSTVYDWAVPMLYGQRLLLGLNFNASESGSGSRTRARGQPLRAIHPFATDRERYYRYSGGDTIGFVQTATRRVPLVRVMVHPDLSIDANYATFDGEIDLDGERLEIVRMRGRFVLSQRMSRLGGFTGVLQRTTNTVVAAFIEFENAEHLGKYWLPTMQRVEIQTTSSLTVGLTLAVRSISHFTDFNIEEGAGVADRTISARRRTEFAPGDSMERFSDWRREIGSASGAVSVKDFEDIAPPAASRREGPPSLQLFPSRIDRAVHFNRIEGLYTGGEATLAFRGLAPGLVAKAWAGWAWAEETLRGGASLSRSWSKSSTALVGERRLVPTEDFLRDFEGASSIGSFLASFEEADWLDRKSIAVSHTRILGSVDNAIVTGKLGYGHDADVAASLTHGPIARSVLYRPNRHARTGSYALGTFGYEFHPNVSGELLQPGFGATFNIQGGAGDLRWLRAEGSASSRRVVGPITFASRFDAGVVLSDDPPPQTLFELGGINGRLSGYEYKEFAGDRAAVARTMAIYNFPILRRPYRIGRFIVPGISPGINASVDAGWTELSTPAARASVLEMGDGIEANALSRPTGGIRSTVSLDLTLLANTIQVGFARPIDQKAPWRFRFLLGQQF